MKKLLTLLIALSTFNVIAQQGDKNFIDQNYIEVTGKAEMFLTPDEIYLKILLDEKDNKNKSSVSELEDLMIKKLQEIGIDVSENLLMKDLSSNFKFYLLTKNKILLSKEYHLIVHDGKTASKVFIELEKIGISNISIEKLENSNIIEHRKDVKINAIKAAKEKAKSLASAIDQEVGKAIYIREERNYVVNENSNTISIRGASSIYGSRASDVIIDFEKIRIEYSILCRFELK